MKAIVKRAATGFAKPVLAATSGFPDAGKSQPVRQQDAELSALQLSIEDSGALSRRKQQEWLSAMAPAQRARHESQELIRLAICARHRQQSLRGN
jgi:hypothetical protein